MVSFLSHTIKTIRDRFSVALPAMFTHLSEHGVCLLLDADPIDLDESSKLLLLHVVKCLTATKMEALSLKRVEFLYFRNCLKTSFHYICVIYLQNVPFVCFVSFSS